MMHNLPAVARRAVLASMEGHSLDVPRNGPLIPVADCQAILGVPVGEAATQDQASRLAEILASSYPKSDAVSPDVYTRGIISILMEHAPDIGADAVDDLTRDRSTLPTRCDVNGACHKITAKRKMAITIARRHLAEQQRRAAEERQRVAAAASWGTAEERARKVREIVEGVTPGGESP